MNYHLMILLTVFSIISSTQSVYSQEAITENKAISIAEKFILENGYTNASKDKIKDNLDYESLTWATNKKQLLAGRYNSLKPIAFGVNEGRRNSKAGWTVVFEFTDDYISKINENIQSNDKFENDVGRAVTMSLEGNDIRIEHVDIFLSPFIKE